MLRHPPWPLFLALATPGCSPTANAIPDDDVEAPTDGSDTEEDDDAPLKLRALIYSTSEEPKGKHTTWLQRDGEDPIPLASSVDEQVDRICVRPDGTGFINWKRHDAQSDADGRLETFEVGEDFARVQAESPTPAGFRPSGCALAWTPGRSIVHLVGSQQIDADEGRLPYILNYAEDPPRVEPIQGASSAWVRIGGSRALERHNGSNGELPSGAALWELLPDPKIVASWAADPGEELEVSATPAWLTLARSSATTRSVAIVPQDNPLRPPLVLGQTSTPNDAVRVTSSVSDDTLLVTTTDEFVPLQPTFVDTTLIRMGADGVAEQLDLGPNVSAQLTGSGYAVYLAEDGQSLFAASVSAGPRVLAHQESAPDAHRMSAVVDGTSDWVLVEWKTADAWSYAVSQASHGSATTLDLGAGCRETTLWKSIAAFRCDRGFEWVDLTQTPPRVESLAELTPTQTASPDSLLFWEWGSERWTHLVYSDGGPYRFVMFQPDSARHLLVPDSGQLGSHTSLPAVFD